MSSTRYAPPGAPIAQKRYASSEEYRTALSGLLVAKRCALLGHEPELRDLIWFMQDRSLPDPYCTGGRLGSVELVADALLTEGGYRPARGRVRIEDFVTGKSSSELESQQSADSRRAGMVAELAQALVELALSPRAAPNALPGLGENWRAVLASYRDKCREAPKKGLAPTSIAQKIAEALRFTRETRKLSLCTGVSRIGKSAASQASCAGSGGIQRYVLTPEDTSMATLYRAVAMSLGVACGTAMKPAQIREIVERTLAASRLMLVFDEAHNFFADHRRPSSAPQRVLWLRRLMDAGAAVALVALPDFYVRLDRYCQHLAWDAAQITDLIAYSSELPAELVPDDFEVLVDRLAPEFPTAAKSLVAGAAKAQRGAQYAVDVIEVARHYASKADRAPSEDDVKKAIDSRPQFVPFRKNAVGRPPRRPPPNRPAEEPAALTQEAVASEKSAGLGGRLAHIPA